MFDASEIAELLRRADQDFVNQAAARMQMGEEKYGPFKFLGVDTLEEGMAEILDLANYARMTYIKLYLLRANLGKLQEEHPAVDTQGFVPMKEFLQNG
jgi:hypothetical protein